MKEILNQQNTQAILNMADQIKKAAIFEGSTQKPFGVQSITLDLSTARLSTDPFKVGFPFKSIYVSSATDVIANINLIPQTRDSYQSAIPFKLNDSWTREEPIAEAYLYWTAQSGKTITIHFFVDSEFRSGSQISQTGGGVAIIDGSSFTTSRVDLTAATATSVLSSDTTRKQCNVQNNTGADVWFGGSSVSNTGANLGQKVSAGSIFIWKNTAALYAYSVAGGSGDNGLQLLTEF